VSAAVARRAASGFTLTSISNVFAFVRPYLSAPIERLIMPRALLASRPSSSPKPSIASPSASSQRDLMKDLYLRPPSLVYSIWIAIRFRYSSLSTLVALIDRSPASVVVTRARWMVTDPSV
jgi:hypothetical protein